MGISDFQIISFFSKKRKNEIWQFASTKYATLTKALLQKNGVEGGMKVDCGWNEDGTKDGMKNGMKNGLKNGMKNGE